MQDLRFLRYAYCLMLIDIYMKFREDSLNSFQVIEWQARVMVLALCTSSNADWYLNKV